MGGRGVGGGGGNRYSVCVCVGGSRCRMCGVGIV